MREEEMVHNFHPTENEVNEKKEALYQNECICETNVFEYMNSYKMSSKEKRKKKVD